LATYERFSPPLLLTLNLSEPADEGLGREAAVMGATFCGLKRVALFAKLPHEEIISATFSAFNLGLMLIEGSPLPFIEPGLLDDIECGY